MNYLIRFFRFIKNHFGKILLTVLFFVVFVVMLFPLGDLSDFISSKVSTLTNNQIYLQFDKLHVNPFSPSVGIDNVVVETRQIENLSIKSLTASPSIMALISKTPGGTLTAEGILSGSAKLKVTPVSGKDKNDPAKSMVDLSLSKVSLKDLRTTMNLSLPISGQLNLNSVATIDLSFAEQPDGDFSAQIQKFELSSANINLPDMGNLSIPEIKFSSVDLKSKFQAGKLTIENLKLGAPSDDLSGSITGDMNVIIQNLNGQIHPVINSYNLSIDLLAKPAFIDRAGFFLSFIDRFQSTEGLNTRYKFKLTAMSPGVPPQFSPLQ